ncbi:(ribosomal protein S18)-alanine N-acetyltransferase [Gammaproteobacteria bacterium]
MIEHCIVLAHSDVEPERKRLRMRPMTDEDLDAVLIVEESVYPFPWSRNIFADCLHHGYCCWVWDFEGGLVGYGVMQVAAGECQILNLTVAASWRRRGLGRAMMTHLLKLARHHRAEMAFLEVRSSNRQAIALYHSLGFNEIGQRCGYYPAPSGREDALILAKVL